MSRYRELLSFHQKHATLHEGTWAAEQFHQRAAETVESMRAALELIAAGASADDARETAKAAIDKADAPV